MCCSIKPGNSIKGVILPCCHFKLTEKIKYILSVQTSSLSESGSYFRSYISQGKSGVLAVLSIPRYWKVFQLETSPRINTFRKCAVSALRPPGIIMMSSYTCFLLCSAELQCRKPAFDLDEISNSPVIKAMARVRNLFL